jgi:hypothetical protein
MVGFRAARAQAAAIEGRRRSRCASHPALQAAMWAASAPPCASVRPHSVPARSRTRQPQGKDAEAGAWQPGGAGGSSFTRQRNGAAAVLAAPPPNHEQHASPTSALNPPPSCLGPSPLRSGPRPARPRARAAPAPRAVKARAPPVRLPPRERVHRDQGRARAGGELQRRGPAAAAGHAAARLAAPVARQLAQGGGRPCLRSHSQSTQTACAHAPAFMDVSPPGLLGGYCACAVSAPQPCMGTHDLRQADASGPEGPDIVAVGLQEVVPLSAGNALLGPSGDGADSWDFALAATLNGDEWWGLYAACSCLHSSPLCLHEPPLPWRQTLHIVSAHRSRAKRPPGAA